MAFEETREQQQMYNYFRSCIYIFLIIEIVMNLPVTADNRITQFILDLLGRFKVFNTVSGCKVAELVCICIVCIGTKAKKALKFNVRTMVVYPVLAGLTLVGLCFVFHGMYFGSPSITTTRWAKTASTSRTNRFNSRRILSPMTIQ